MNLNAMTAADVQIQLVEREKAQALADVETALKRQADLQVMAELVLPREGWGTTPPTPTPHFPPPPPPIFHGPSVQHPGTRWKAENKTRKLQLY